MSFKLTKFFIYLLFFLLLCDWIKFSFRYSPSVTSWWRGGSKFLPLYTSTLLLDSVSQEGKSIGAFFSSHQIQLILLSRKKELMTNRVITMATHIYSFVFIYSLIRYCSFEQENNDRTNKVNEKSLVFFVFKYHLHRNINYQRENKYHSDLFT